MKGAKLLQQRYNLLIVLEKSALWGLFCLWTQTFLLFLGAEAPVQLPTM